MKTKEKHQSTKAVSVRTRRRRSIYCMIWKQKRKCGPKNTIVQMKEKKKKLILKIETSYT
jgi:hypothetical protein